MIRPIIFEGARGTLEILEPGTVEAEAMAAGERIYTLSELPEMLAELQDYKIAGRLPEVATEVPATLEPDPFEEAFRENLTKPLGEIPPSPTTPPFAVASELPIDTLEELAELLTSRAQVAAPKPDDTDSLATAKLVAEYDPATAEIPF